MRIHFDAASCRSIAVPCGTVPFQSEDRTRVGFSTLVPRTRATRTTTIDLVLVSTARYVHSMTVYRDGAKQGGLSHLTARIVFLAAQQAMARARARARRGAPLIPFGRAEAGRVHAWIPAWRQCDRTLSRRGLVEILPCAHSPEREGLKGPSSPSCLSFSLPWGSMSR